MAKRIFSTLLIVMATIATYAAMPSHVTWSFEITRLSDNEGTLNWHADIEPGWHIYGLEVAEGSFVEPTTFTVTPAEGLVLVGKVSSSKAPEINYDEDLKASIPTFDGKVSFSQKFKLEGAKSVVINSAVDYMACDAHQCTPPATSEFTGEFTANNFKATSSAPKPEPVAVETPAAEGNPQPQEQESVVEENEVAQPIINSDLTLVTPSDKFAQWWEPVDIVESNSSDNTWFAIFFLGFLGGLLALFTPCVWPMIPMTMSFFLKKGKNRRRAIGDAVTYGLSIIAIFVVLGILLTVLFGASKLNEMATGAVFNIIFFLLLVVFAISFFGAFEITLPSRWSNKIDSKAESTTGMLSIFFMAFTLVLVSFSCTGPIIGTLLVEAASQASIMGPALGMFGFALGLALPFGFFAFFPSLLKELPKSGGWLSTVKVVLGFIELILSLKFLSVADLAYGWHILDREVFISIWIVLFALLGLFLLGKLRFAHSAESNHTSVPGFFLAVLSFSFAVYLVPGLWGAPLKSISAFAPPLTTQDFNLYGGTFKEFDNYDEGMAYAAENKMPVLIDFSGFACVNCRKMEGAVFDTQQVRQIIENNFVLIRLMVDDKEKLAEPIEVEEYNSITRITTVGARWSYLQRHKFGTNSQPYYVMIDNDGKALGPSRSYDENVEAFIDWLNQGAAKFQSGK